MKIILLFFIRCYWALVPARFRRTCLFRCSCSRYVYNATRSDGFTAGIKALRQRVRQCRPGYQIGQSASGHVFIVLADGTIADNQEIRADLCAPVAASPNI